MPSRRLLLSSFIAAPIVLPRLGQAAGVSQNFILQPTCADDDDLTPAQTEGPYFTPDSPLKHDFTADSPRGEKIGIGGYLLTRDCKPVGGRLRGTVARR